MEDRSMRKLASMLNGRGLRLGLAHLVRSLLVALTALAVLAGTALGAKPIEQFHDHFTDSFSGVICGIPVDIDIVVTDNFFVYADGSFTDTASVMQTFTNPVNGASVAVSSAGRITGTAIVDEEAGTITFLTSFIGLPERIQTSGGPVLSRDAGIITFADTFDLETGEFISFEITVNKGPHPEADAEFALFCEVITEALT
jgi:hypothetical protein